MTDRSDGDTGPATEAMPTDSTQSSGWLLSGRYRIAQRLGSGGMAEVFRARDESLDRDVAVKVFRTPVDEPGNASAVERREVELQALARLSHPNLTALYDGSLAEGQPAYLVMEFVDGPDLATRLRQEPLTYTEARVLGAQIAGALGYVHARGMVHRDVKPANILLGHDGDTELVDGLRARLSDFGIVRIIDAPALTHAAFTLGSASYLAPEQARGSNVGPPADVYALGLVLLEALTGVRAYDGPMHEAVAARLVTAPDIPATLPPPWPGLLAAMTALDPAVRPSAAEVARVLSADRPIAFPPPVSATAPTAVVAPGARPPVAPLPPAQEEGRKRGWIPIAIAAAVAVVVLVIVGLLLWGPGSSGPSPATTITNTPTQHTSSAAATTGQNQTSQPPTSAPTTAHRTTAPSTSHPPTTSTSSSTAPSSSAPSTTSSSPSTSSAPSSPSSPSPPASGGAAGSQPAPVSSSVPETSPGAAR